MVGASRIFARAVRDFPQNAALLNSAGSFHAGADQPDTALTYFDRALKADPGHDEALLNRAITLSKLNRAREALADLEQAHARLGSMARYWSVRAGIEARQADRDAAAASYDACLAINSTEPRALHGRARMALERGEAAMVERFSAALALKTDDPQLWLGFAQALDASGRASEARRTAESIIRQLPTWVDALEFLAQLRWMAGEREHFTDHYEGVVQQHPGEASLYHSWCRTLAGVDRFAEAATVAARGRAALPADAQLALAEATHAGEAGDMARAQAIFRELDHHGPDRWLQEARHRLRSKDPQQADALLERVLAAHPELVSAWALRDLAWRMLNDPRSAWLHEQDGLVQLLPLEIDLAGLAAFVDVLEGLHDSAGMPVGQSVREGTQTRGGLFDRREPEIRAFRRTVEAAIERYRAGLPASDPAHPLLRHRAHPWAIRGSWSIRMLAGGHHTEHIHPQGLLSSAAYLLLPEASENSVHAGSLELGRSPPDLRIDLPPVSTIAPKVGHCALFPSTLYHGTRPFESGRRMTVAFDVTVADA